MDSLTHIILGAAIGEVTLGKKIGNKALLWGGLLSVIPDLDVLISPFISPVSALFFHRGISHSLLFVLIVALIAGYAISCIEKKHSIAFKSWIYFSLLPLLAHIFIDCFNTYGTGIFEPFSHVRVSYDSIAIIDFLFMLPISIAVIWAMFYQKQKRVRRILVWFGLGLSTIYFCFTILNKINIESIAKKQLAQQGLVSSRLLTTPVPLSNFIWLIVAENESGFNMGYYSNFDTKEEIKFRFLPRNSELLGTLKDLKEVKEIVRFTKGFYTVDKGANGSLWIYDLRYSSLDFERENAYVFSFEIKETSAGVKISRSHPNRSINLQTITKYFKKFF